MKTRHYFCLLIVLMSQPSYARDWVVFSESPSIKLEISADESPSEPGIEKVGMRIQFLGKMQEMALKDGYDRTEFDIEFNCQAESFRHVGDYVMFRDGKQVKSEPIKGAGAWNPLGNDSDEYAVFDHICQP